MRSPMWRLVENVWMREGPAGKSQKKTDQNQNISRKLLKENVNYLLQADLPIAGEFADQISCETLTEIIYVLATGHKACPSLSRTDLQKIKQTRKQQIAHADAHTGEWTKT